MISYQRVNLARMHKSFLYVLFITLFFNTSYGQNIITGNSEIYYEDCDTRFRENNISIDIHKSKPAIAIIGNSTIAAYAGGEAIAVLMNKDSEYSITDISVPGHTIKQQEAKWRKIPPEVKQSLDFVFVEIGNNDLSPEVSVDTTLFRYQSLIDLIRSETSKSCRIITSTMTPLKKRLLLKHPDNHLLYYEKWRYMNKAIIGKGPDKIVNFDSYCKKHTKILNDGKDNLKPMYDTGDGTHTTTAARQVIADEWIAKINWYNNKK